MHLSQLPTRYLSLAILLEDIGRPSAAELAKVFKVSPRTARRWIDADQAPPAVMFSLYWLTRWGAAQIYNHAEHGERLQLQRVAALEREVDRLRFELARVLRLADFGSANAPLLEEVRPAPAEVRQIVKERRPPGGGR